MRLTLLMLMLAAPAGAQDIGVATAVVPDARGIQEGGAEQVLNAGSRVHANERIVAGPAGRVQLTFTDGTSLNVGAGSDLVLDRYVFDPERDAGEMATTLSKGVLRFVGGRVSKKKRFKVKTPLGTVGIRGGIGTVSYTPGGDLEAVFLYGEEMTVTAGEVTRTVRRPGFGVRVPAEGPPSVPKAVSPEKLGATMGRLERGVEGTKQAVGAARAALSSGLASFGRMASVVAPLPGQLVPGAPTLPGDIGVWPSGPLSVDLPGVRLPNIERPRFDLSRLPEFEPPGRERSPF